MTLQQFIVGTCHSCDKYRLLFCTQRVQYCLVCIRNTTTFSRLSPDDRCNIYALFQITTSIFEGGHALNNNILNIEKDIKLRGKEWHAKNSEI